MSDKDSAGLRGTRKKRICSRSEISIRFRIFDCGFDGNSVTGAGWFSGKDPRRNGDSLQKSGCGGEWDCDGVVAHDERSKVCGLGAESSSPFPVRAWVDESTGVAAGKSFRSGRGRPGCKGCGNGPSLLR